MEAFIVSIVHQPIPDVTKWAAWNPVAIEAAVIERSWKLQDRYRISYWDSLIVAAARVASCGFLLSEDFQNGQRIDGVEVVNPFLRGPGSVHDPTVL